MGSLVPGVGPFLGALGGVVSDIEQKESIDILGLSMSGVLEILSNSYGNGTVKVFSYLWACFDLNESINQNGDKQFYVYEGIKLFEGDTLIKVKEEYDLGMVNSTYVGVVRNNCVLALLPYYAPRIDQPVDGYINQGYVNQLRSEWLEENYIDAP